jgi:HlyD family secretion protein
MTRLMQISTVAVAVASVAGAGLWTMNRRGNETPSYRTAAVEVGTVRSSVSASGTLSAVRTVEVGTQVSGQIAELRADFNDQVKKGQLLARIDPKLLQQAVQDADAGLTRADAQLAQAQEEYDRTKALHDEKIVTETEYNTARTNLALTRTSVTSAKIALERAKQNLSYSNIYAPIDGVVIERDIDLGQTVAASLSAPKLFVIANDLSQMRILASVDETDIGSIKEGQSAQFTVQSFQNRSFRGTVDQVRLASTSANNVVSYTVVVNVDNKDGALLPGMTATVQFITGEATDVLTVPNTALRFRPPTKAGDSTSVSTRTAGGPPSGAMGGAMGGGAAGGPPSGMGGGMGGGAGGGMPRGAGGAGGARGGFGTVYTLVGDSLVAHRVRTGITDGTRTEVSGKTLTKDLVIVIGSSTGSGSGASSSGSTTASPFQQSRTSRQPGPPTPF